MINNNEGNFFNLNLKLIFKNVCMIIFYKCMYLFFQDKSEEILKNFYSKFKEAGIQFILTNSDVLEPKGGLSTNFF